LLYYKQLEHIKWMIRSRRSTKRHYNDGQTLQ